MAKLLSVWTAILSIILGLLELKWRARNILVSTVDTGIASLGQLNFRGKIDDQRMDVQELKRNLAYVCIGKLTA